MQVYSTSLVCEWEHTGAQLCVVPYSAFITLISGTEFVRMFCAFVPHQPKRLCRWWACISRSVFSVQSEWLILFQNMQVSQVGYSTDSKLRLSK